MNLQAVDTSRNSVIVYRRHNMHDYKVYQKENANMKFEPDELQDWIVHNFAIGPGPDMVKQLT